MKEEYSILRIVDNIASRRIITSAGCWEYNGARDSHGYGSMNFRGSIVSVHRFIMWIVFGVPLHGRNHTLHSCDNPPCFNPLHLSSGTSRDNQYDRYKRHPVSKNKKTHCKRGHEYTEENSYYDSKGMRFCRVCNRLSHSRKSK